MSSITNEFVILLDDYRENRRLLSELEGKYRNKPKPTSYHFMKDVYSMKLNRLSGKIKKTGTSKSIIKVTGTFWDQSSIKTHKLKKSFEIYFINEILSTDLKLLLSYYVKDLIEFKANIIITGKPTIINGEKA